MSGVRVAKRLSANTKGESTARLARYDELWRKLNPDPAVGEPIRNYPLPQPVLWV